MPGALTGGETPGPIPNPEVKTSRADDTAVARLWESRSAPGIFVFRPRWAKKAMDHSTMIHGLFCFSDPKDSPSPLRGSPEPARDLGSVTKLPLLNCSLSAQPIGIRITYNIFRTFGKRRGVVPQA